MTSAGSGSTGTTTSSSTTGTDTTGDTTGGTGSVTSGGTTITTGATGSSGPTSGVGVATTAGTSAAVGSTGAGGASGAGGAGGAGGDSMGSVTSIRIFPATSTVAPGATEQLIATAFYSNGGTADVTSGRATWGVDPPNVVAVYNGRVVAIAPGTAQVSASLVGVKGQATVTVPAITLTAVTIAPDPATIVAGGAIKLEATGTYSDGSTADVSAAARWSVDDRAIATVTGSIATGTTVANGLAPGTTIVHATLGGLGSPMTSGAAKIIVTAAP
jgi:hypothetical protein